MSDHSDILKGFFETEYHSRKQKQANSETQKELLEYRIRFLKTLLDEMQDLENKLTDQDGAAPSEDAPLSDSNGDEGDDQEKLRYTINRLCACEELIENELQELSDMLKFIKMKYEHASEEIEGLSQKICKIQNGDDGVPSAELPD
jgi:chromosome segregation ATPase